MRPIPAQGCRLIRIDHSNSADESAVRFESRLERFYFSKSQMIDIRTGATTRHAFFRARLQLVLWLTDQIGGDTDFRLSSDKVGDVRAHTHSSSVTPSGNKADVIRSLPDNSICTSAFVKQVILPGYQSL